MPVKLKAELKDSIPVNQMKDGQIGVITRWGSRTYLGLTVQRYRNDLIGVGVESGVSWPFLFKEPAGELQHLHVSILPTGTELTIENNE